MRVNFNEVEYVDAHSHLAGFTDDEIERIIKQKILIFAVSYDYSSIFRTIDLAKKFDNVVPFIGIHPWETKNFDLAKLEGIFKLVDNAFGFGEIGLDMRFGRDYFDKQLKFFEKVVEFAAERNLPLNLHALDAWHMVFKIISNNGIKKAIFHWYSGPLDLLKEIEAQGYFITINPCVRFQRKHLAVLNKVSLDIVLTESDGPYKYRGLDLHPFMVKDLVNYIAQIKGIEEEVVKRQILTNARKFLQK